MERKALGKGLGALIPGREAMSRLDISQSRLDNNVLINVQTGQIKANPFQPREDFDQASIEELAQSIREKGVIQPLLVRRKGDDYELIAGERRLRAAQLLNLQEVPVIVKDVSDEESLEIALIENLQREDLNPIEEARAYQYLIQKFQITQERLGEILGKARVTVTNILRLLNLPQEIQEEIRKGRLSYAQGRALLELGDPNQMRRMAQEAIARQLSVSELESRIKMQLPRGFKRRMGASLREPYLTVLEEQLQHVLSTKVRISKRNKRGHILIEFYSQEELERIVNIIKQARAI